MCINFQGLCKINFEMYQRCIKDIPVSVETSTQLSTYIL